MNAGPGVNRLTFRKIGRKSAAGYFSSEDVLKALPDAVVLVDTFGTIRYVTEAAEHLTGYSQSDLLGQPVEVLVPIAQHYGHILERTEFSRDPTPRPMGGTVPKMLARKDGSEIPVDIGLGVMSVGAERWTLATIRDKSVQTAAEQARADAELRFRLAFEDNMGPMTFVDLEDRFTAANDAFCQMIGRTREEVLGSDSSHFTYPGDRYITTETHHRLISDEIHEARYVKRYLHKDGRVIIVEVSKSPARDAAGRTLYFVVSQRDITGERALTDQLIHRTLHDPLTGLANRVFFQDRLPQAHASVVRNGGLGAVLFLDLDDFKGVNDTHGHLVGDQLLVAVAHRLERATRASETICHFGGDEFVYLVEGLNTAAEAEAVATRLLDVLVEPFFIAGTCLEQRASIGVMVWDGTRTDHTEFVQDADVAMYVAKSQGKGHHVVFTPSMRHQAV